MKLFTKSTLALAAAACMCGGVQAQYQLPNAGFEGEWQLEQTRSAYTSDAADGWNSFLTAETAGLTSIAFTFNQVGTSTQSTDAYEGSYSMLIVSKQNMLGSISNGNLTTGRIHMGATTAASEENYNYSDIEDEQYSQTFDGLPDSLVVWVKFLPQQQDDTASVSCILHKAYNYKQPYATDEEVAEYRIGSVDLPVMYVGREWQRVSAPLEYDGSNFDYDGQKYVLISITTNQNAGEGSSADSLFVDAIEFIYNSELAYVEVDGTQYEVPEGATEFSVPVPYDGDVRFVANGASATVEAESADGQSDTYTVTVRGGDYDEAPENVNVYTVHFSVASGISEVNAAATPGLTIRNISGGVELTAEGTVTVPVYTLDARLVGIYTVQEGVQTINLPAGFYIVGGQKVVVW